MRKVLFSVSLAMGAMLSYQKTQAQVVLPFPSLDEPRLIVTGGSPADGMKVFTISSSANPAWGGAITTPINAMPVVKAVDSLACTALTNGSGGIPALTNKAALIFRGSCEFGAKALAAQNAGAAFVVVVTNNNLGPIPMGGGAVGGSVTIPVVMVSQADGMLMNDAILANQPVNISITNWGFGKTSDAGLIKSSIATGHGLRVPKTMLDASNDNPKEYQILTGAVVGNFGTGDLSKVEVKQVVKWAPTGGTATQVWRDSVSAAHAQIDSLVLYSGNTGYNPHPTTTGRYTMDYSLVTTPSDEMIYDNSLSTYMDITDSIFCKSSWNDGIDRPNTSISYRFNNATNFLAGPMFYIGVNGYSGAKADFYVSDGSDPAGPLNNVGSAEVFLMKWDDANGDSLINGSEAELIGIGSKTFTASDMSQSFFDVEFVNANDPSEPVVLEKGFNYWMPVGITNQVYVGFDASQNFWTRSASQFLRNPSVSEFYSPTFPDTRNAFIGDTASAFPFVNAKATNPFYVDNNTLYISNNQQSGLVPSMSLHITKTPLSVNSVKKNKSTISIAPNPAKDQITLNVKFDKQAKNVYYNVYTVLGQRIESFSRGNITQEAFSMDISQYPTGNYIVVIVADGVPTVQKFTVAH